MSKAHADRRCVVQDSGEEFTGIGFADEQNRPYVRFRAGLGDCKAGGKAIVLWRTLCARQAGGEWHVRDRIPGDWPDCARDSGGARGSAPFGPAGQARWLTGYTNDRFDPESSSEIFLYHLGRGYAARGHGPARLP